MNYKTKEIDILGSKWTIKIVPNEEDPILEKFAGYTDSTTRTIVVGDGESNKNDKLGMKCIDNVLKRVLRHEIIHAFLFESGLDGDSNSHKHWACNEEMVDWVAIQLPKINKACDEAECIERS